MIHADRKTNALIAEIVERAKKIHDAAAEKPLDTLSLSLDLASVHLNGRPLDLLKLLAAPDFDFCYDVFGISRNLDRRNARLSPSFEPRYALREKQVAA